MNQKEIWLSNLNPVVGSEQSGLRPVVIISGQSMNENYSVVIICPLTTKIKTYMGCPVIQPSEKNNLKHTSQAIPFQIRTLSKLRLKKNLGVITDLELQKIKEGLFLFLQY